MNVHMARSAYIPLYIIENDSCTFHLKLKYFQQILKEFLFYYKDFSCILGLY